MESLCYECNTEINHEEYKKNEGYCYSCKYKLYIKICVICKKYNNDNKNIICDKCKIYGINK